MNIEEIRKNSPEGATHYFVDGDAIVYLKVSKHGFVEVLLFENWVLFGPISIIIEKNEIKPL